MSKVATLTGYSTREVASLLEVPESRVRYFVRQGLLEPDRGPRRELRFTFRDLVVLRAAKGLLAEGISPARVRQVLQALPAQLPQGRSLSSVRITVEGPEIVVQESQRRWNPESGQALLDFEVAPLAAAAAPLAPRLVRDARSPAGALAAEEWFDVACELEVTAPEEAARIYERALELAPEHAAAHLNLGRLRHEAGELEEADRHYRRALELGPSDPIAAYNLAVALEDRGRLEEARELYEAAVEADPTHADAHFNLAGVCEKLGQGAEALRHLKEYKALVGTPARRS